MSTHICGNPSFDMFICLACHPECAPLVKPPQPNCIGPESAPTLPKNRDVEMGRKTPKRTLDKHSGI